MRLEASRAVMPELSRASMTDAALPRSIGAAMSLSRWAMGSPAVRSLRGRMRASRTADQDRYDAVSP